MNVLTTLLLIFLIGCAIATIFTRRLLTAVIVFMSYSTIMSIIWLILQSPDLAITEAAVGAGVTTVLFVVTLRRIGAMGGVDDDAQD